MRSVFVTAVIAASLFAPTAAFAQAPETPQAVFQAVRAGDEQLTCEAMTAEVGALSAQIQQLQAATAPEKPRRRGLGGLASLAGGLGGFGGVAAAFIPGAGLAIGAAQLLSAAGPLIDQAEAASQAEAAAQTTDPALLQQRVDHLTGLAQGAGC